eukprot:132931_1
MNDLQIEEDLYFWNKKQNKLWYISHYAVHSIDINGNVTKMKMSNPGVYWIKHKYMVQHSTKLYLFSSRTNYSTFKIKGNDLYLVKEKIPEDSFCRTDGVCIIAPKGDKVLILGGWADKWDDQECDPLTDCIIYNCDSNKWQSKGVNLNIYGCGSFIDNDCLYILGGFKEGDGSDELLDRIVRIDTRGAFQVQKSKLKCPDKGACICCLFDDHLYGQFSAFAYVHDYEKEHKKLYLNTPKYLIGIIGQFVAEKTIYWVNTDSKEMWTVAFQKK